jgi:hypothetical protein
LSPADDNLLKSTDANTVINVTFLMKVSPNGAIHFVWLVSSGHCFTLFIFCPSLFWCIFTFFYSSTITTGRPFWLHVLTLYSTHSCNQIHMHTGLYDWL